MLLFPCIYCQHWACWYCSSPQLLMDIKNNVFCSFSPLDPLQGLCPWTVKWPPNPWPIKCWGTSVPPLLHLLFGNSLQLQNLLKALHLGLVYTTLSSNLLNLYHVCIWFYCHSMLVSTQKVIVKLTLLFISWFTILAARVKIHKFVWSEIHRWGKIT